MKQNIKKILLDGSLFFGIMFLTFWSVFKNQNFSQVVQYAKQMSAGSLVSAVLLSVGFISGEGCMIWYLLKGIGENTRLCRCISYSFIGFFFSGITPSATGGQPMQLYYMKKDGNSLSASSVVLMTVAVIYKLVLVLLGIGLWLFCRTMLRTNLKSYYWLYFTGLFLNIIVVTVLVFIMLSPQIAYRCFEAVEKLLISLHVCKVSNSRKDKVKQFLNGYRETLDFLKNHKEMILFTIAGTFLQRFTLFLLTGVVYWGMGFSAVTLWKIIWLQASIYIAVDMLPIPGAQGITEAMYRNVFADIFTGGYITASLCVSRGISFYLMLLAGLIVFIFRQYTCKRIMLFRHKKQCDISISHNIKSEL